MKPLKGDHIMGNSIFSLEGNYFRNRIRYNYSKFRGFYRINVNNHSAIFKVEDKGDFLILDYIDKFERSVLADILRTVKQYESPTVFDIGSNLGIHAILAKKTLPKSEVVAIEPFPTNAHRLLQNINLNDVDIKVVQVIISDIEELVSLSGFNDKPQSDGTVSMWGEGNVYSWSKTLANLVESGDWQIPDIVKIDVEGAEGKVLRGLKPIIGEIDTIYYEMHQGSGNSVDKFDDDANSIHTFVEENGFSLEQLKHKHGRNWKATSS